jgi:hypothetical protein
VSSVLSVAFLVNSCVYVLSGRPCLSAREALRGPFARALRDFLPVARRRRGHQFTSCPQEIKRSRETFTFS